MKRKLPLFVITGASGSGKTTVILELQRALPELIVFDMDFMDGVDWEMKGTNWLYVAHCIAAGGRSTVLVGNVHPHQLQSLRLYTFFEFSHVHYLILHCDDETRERRLQLRGWPTEWIAYSCELDKSLLLYADACNPVAPVIDTTNSPSIKEVAAAIKKWIHKNS